MYNAYDIDLRFSHLESLIKGYVKDFNQFNANWDQTPSPEPMNVSEDIWEQWSFRQGLFVTHDESSYLRFHTDFDFINLSDVIYKKAQPFMQEQKFLLENGKWSKNAFIRTTLPTAVGFNMRYKEMSPQFKTISISTNEDILQYGIQYPFMLLDNKQFFLFNTQINTGITRIQNDIIKNYNEGYPVIADRYIEEEVDNIVVYNTVFVDDEIDFSYNRYQSPDGMARKNMWSVINSTVSIPQYNITWR